MWAIQSSAPDSLGVWEATRVHRVLVVFQKGDLIAVDEEIGYVQFVLCGCVKCALRALQDRR